MVRPQWASLAEVRREVQTVEERKAAQPVLLREVERRSMLRYCRAFAFSLFQCTKKPPFLGGGSFGIYIFGPG